MKNYIYKSVMRTSLGFMTIIIYCMISMISYLDLCYMLVVIGFFITYIKYVREL